MFVNYRLIKHDSFLKRCLTAIVFGHAGAAKARCFRFASAFLQVKQEGIIALTPSSAYFGGLKAARIVEAVSVRRSKLASMWLRALSCASIAHRLASSASLDR